MLRERVVRAIADLLRVPIRFGDGASSWNGQSVLIRPVANGYMVTRPEITLGNEAVLGTISIPGTARANFLNSGALAEALERALPFRPAPADTPDK